MSNLSDVLIALGLIAAFAVVFIALMRLHKATYRIDMRSKAGDGGDEIVIFGGDAGSCVSGGCGGGD